MKLLHLHGGSLYGGVETFLITLARDRALCPEMEHRFAMCFEQRLTKELREAGLPVTMVGEARFKNPLSVIKARRNLARLIRAEKPDVGLCHMAKPLRLFAPVLRRFGIPVVYYMHGPIHQHIDLFDKLIRKGTPPDLMIGVSNHTVKTGVETLFPNVATATVYYPMPWPESRYESDAASRTALRKEFNTAETDTVIIQATRMNEWKGQKNLLAALGLLKDLPGWTHWLVGAAQNDQEVAYADSLKQMANDLGIADRVRFVGQRNDVPRLLPASDVYCQANNESEGFSLSFTEAFSAGLPVVTTDIGSASEMITPDCGALTPLHDAPALAAALRELIENPEMRRAKGQAARRRIKTLSDPQQQMRLLHRELSRVARPNAT